MPSIKMSPDEIVNEMAMSKDGYFLILEGEKDGLFFKHRNFPKKTNIVICFGWEKALDVCTIARKRNFQHKVIAILDRDYRNTAHSEFMESDCQIILTDFHSVESIMYWSSAFFKVVSEYGSDKKITSRYGSLYEFRDDIAEKSSPLGKYRLYCYRNSIYVKFNEIDYTKFISKDDFSIDVAKLLQHLRGFLNNKGKIKKEDWDLAQDDEQCGDYLDMKFLCHGHDIMNFLAISLQKSCGSRPGKTDGAEVEKYFRMSYENGELVKTKMWSQILKKMI